MDLDENQFKETLQMLAMDPFSILQLEKEERFEKALSELTRHHISKCHQYKSMVNHLRAPLNWDCHRLESFPFIPVRLFKHLELKSIEEKDIFKEMLSSGTSNQERSRIILDRYTAQKQSTALSKLFKEFIGLNRPPILVVDAPDAIKNRATFSARTAGILGFSYFGKDLTFALRNDFTINMDLIKEFIAKHFDETVLIFGFTSIIWEHFLTSPDLKDSNLVFPNSVLVHGGGWKKLSDQNVNNDLFKSTLSAELNVQKVINYYGLVEQTGSLFFECASGFFHSSIYSNVIVRDSDSFAAIDPHNIGMLQLQSLLPFSYPGHSILTEDLGEIMGVDNCDCGRNGQIFRVYGRIPEAEVRGCSDTFER